VTTPEVGVIEPESASKVVVAPLALIVWKEGSDPVPFDVKTKVAVEGETEVIALLAPPTSTSCCVIALPEIAVPLPDNTPVAVVVSVIAGVVVGLATVPAKPFALTTETVVTVPPVAGFCQLGDEPVVAVRTCPVVPAASQDGTPLFEVIKTPSLAVASAAMVFADEA
jgi:hypothetical protein